MIRYNKRGNLLDIPFFIVALLVVTFFFIIAAFFMNTYFEGIKGNEFFNNSAVDNLENVSEGVINTFDKSVAFFMIVFLLVTIFFASRLRTNPILFGASLVLLIVSVVLAAKFTNIFEALFVDSPTLGSTTAQFPVASYIFAHLPSFILYLGGIILLVVLVKKRFSDE